MLYLVEGLNCSGKTTWINKTAAIFRVKHITTPWANPLRWEGDSFKGRHCISKVSMDAYAVGVYETVLNLYTKHYPIDVYWDRTFISARAYGSLSATAYDYLIKLCLELNDVGIIFLDTSPDECLHRLDRLRQKDASYKDYIHTNDKVSAFKVLHNFYKLMSQANSSGIVVQFIK